MRRNLEWKPWLHKQLLRLKAIPPFLGKHWDKIFHIILTAMLVLVAYKSFEVDRDLVALQTQVSRYNVRPFMQGRFVHPPSGTFLLQNIGGDTAFGVWCSARYMAVCDSLLVYDYYKPHPFSLLRDHTGSFGAYSEDARHKMAPGEEEEIQAKLAYDYIGEVAKLLGGVLFVEANYVYWDNVPLERYSEIEYFLIGSPTIFGDEHASLSAIDGKAFWRDKIDSLKSLNLIAEADIISEIFLNIPAVPDSVVEKLYTVVKTGRTNYFIGTDWIQWWRWRDTFLIYNGDLLAVDSVRELVRTHTVGR